MVVLEKCVHHDGMYGFLFVLMPLIRVRFLMREPGEILKGALGVRAMRYVSVDPEINTTGIVTERKNNQYGRIRIR